MTKRFKVIWTDRGINKDNEKIEQCLCDCVEMHAGAKQLCELFVNLLVYRAPTKPRYIVGVVP